jgi:hypothetical protein
MRPMNPNEILLVLKEQAERRFGPKRAGELLADLETTARELAELDAVDLEIFDEA